MAYNGIAKVQHYVPQFLLRNFGNGKKNQLYVFDKQKARSFASNTRNIACESRFYDFQVDGEEFSIEPALSKIEGAAKPLLQRIIDEDCLAVLSDDEQAQLAVFLSIQYTRTRWFRENWRMLPEILGEKVRQMVKDDEKLKYIDEYIGTLDENKTKKEMAVIMMKAPTDFAIHFANKVWMLLKTERKRPFIMGDNPLTFQNTNDMGPFGNIGLAVRGIEIYLPLSPTHALALWCPSYEKIFRDALERLRFVSKIAPHLIAQKLHDPSGIERILDAMETGKPLVYNSDEVLNFNSLQVYHAERYVFSSIDDFDLARKVISKNSETQKGPRYQVK